MLECENNSIYTGITNDIERRFSEHIDTSKRRKGAKYTLAFKPKRIAAVFSVKDRSSALSLEAKIKSIKRANKLELIGIYDIEHLKKPKRIYVNASIILKKLP